MRINTSFGLKEVFLYWKLPKVHYKGYLIS